MKQRAARAILEAAQGKELSKEDFSKLKLKITRAYHLDSVPRNADILAEATEEERAHLLPVLQRKLTRSLSGVSVIAVMARPMDVCPHGVCAFCPKGREAPRSYTGFEPAAQRARHNDFDSWRQVTNRIDQLQAIGHSVDKVELILMGGTFPFQDWQYQQDFVHGCYDALLGERTPSLDESKKRVETATIRPIGLTVETRPDWAKQEHIDQILYLGGTRVELGVQILNDAIYKKVNRGHTVQDVIESTQLLKDAGLKINYHTMPGLPDATRDVDLKSFHAIFENPDFKPDMLKIYPTLVMPGTPLHAWWKRGEYTPLTSEESADLIVEIKKNLPRWVRVMRILRDIPANLISEGVQRSDLRELVKEKCVAQGVICNCIRCREIGHKYRSENILPQDIEIRTETYAASNGTEHFISAEDFEQNILVGYARLRFPSKAAHRIEVTAETAILRELHVYGFEVPVGKTAMEGVQVQHRGWGKKLLTQAEETARDAGYEQLIVTSGIGARAYYRKFGYADVGAYVGKKL